MISLTLPYSHDLSQGRTKKQKKLKTALNFLLFEERFFEDHVVNPKTKKNEASKLKFVFVRSTETPTTLEIYLRWD